MSMFSRMPRAYPDHNLPDNGEVFFAYDAAQRMTRRTDQVPDNTAFVFDRANRMTQRTYPDALNDTFTYDQASRLLTASSARYNNVVTRVYDDASRLTSETLTVGGQNFPVQSAYDAANRRTSITYPDGKVVAQAFTDRNQLSSISYDGSSVATLAYDVGMRQTTKTFINGKVETRTYRLDNRLTQIQTPGVTDFTYTYDANKNPLTKNFALDTSDNQTYTYDAEDRLTNFARQSGFNQNWTLTLVGDWSAFNNNGNAETRTHNNVHELTAINAGSLAYDLKGNLTSNSNGQAYTWDFENLMKSATIGADTANYEYDAFRRRVKKTFQGASTVFAYDGWRCVAEYENGASASSPARDFVFGTYLDEPLMMVTAPAGAATKRYYHSDHLYSIYALTDAGGAVVERYRYTAYGQATVLTAGFAAKTDPNYSEFGNGWTFTGQRLDQETGLHYYKNRHFDGGLGRFVSRDPIEYRGGKNLYSYVRNRALRKLDLLGLIDWEPSYDVDYQDMDEDKTTTVTYKAAKIAFSGKFECDKDWNVTGFTMAATTEEGFRGLPPGLSSLGTLRSKPSTVKGTVQSVSTYTNCPAGTGLLVELRITVAGSEIDFGKVQAPSIPIPGTGGVQYQAPAVDVKLSGDVYDQVYVYTICCCKCESRDKARIKLYKVYEPRKEMAGWDWASGRDWDVTPHHDLKSCPAGKAKEEGSKDEGWVIVPNPDFKK